MKSPWHASVATPSCLHPRLSACLSGHAPTHPTAWSPACVCAWQTGPRAAQLKNRRRDTQTSTQTHSPSHLVVGPHLAHAEWLCACLCERAASAVCGRPFQRDVRPLRVAVSTHTHSHSHLRVPVSAQQSLALPAVQVSQRLSQGPRESRGWSLTSRSRDAPSTDRLSDRQAETLSTSPEHRQSRQQHRQPLELYKPSTSNNDAPRRP